MQYFVQVAIGMWYNRYMKNDKSTVTNNDEIVTILRTENERLQQQVERLTAQLAAVNNADNVVISSAEYEELKQQVDWLTQQLITMQKDKYATKSEAWKEVTEQLSLMANEPESYLVPNTVKEIQVPSHKRQRKLSLLNEEKLPDNIETEVIEHKPDNTVCPECGTEMTVIGKEVKRRLKIVPAKVSIIEDWYYTYACENCKKNGTEVPVVKAIEEAPFIKGSYATAEAVAYLMTQKYVMASPLYRLEQEINEQGVALSRQTMSNWIMTAEYDYLRPVYNKLRERMLKEDILHADETELKVLKLAKQNGSNKGYMWLFRTGRYSSIPTVLYRYEPTRSGDTAKEFLRGFNGYLQTDGYTGYHKVRWVTHIGCWAHARRKFVEAIEAKKGDTIASEGFEYCERLFMMEKETAELSSEERYEFRQQNAVPLLKEFKAWADQQRVPAKSKIGKALTYLDNQWEYLINYTMDGRLEISNNIAERSIKPFVIDRKNFLFSNTPNGAMSTAVTMSIIETAKANNLNPYKYLEWIFKTAPSIANPEDESQSWALLLMPENAPDECRTKIK